MAKQKQKPRKQRSASVAKASKSSSGKKTRSRIKWKGIALFLSLVSLSFIGLAGYKSNWDKSHDLSVIGNGVPTVVQIHDPSCGHCRRLKENTETAIRLTEGSLQFRIADITTAPGRAFSIRHNVPKTTLLTFDSAGKLLDKYGGVRSPESLVDLFTVLAKPRGYKAKVVNN